MEVDEVVSRQYCNAKNLDARIELHRRFSTNPESWFRWLFSKMQFPAEARILELGCGTGRLWLENLDDMETGWRLTLSDLSQGMLAEAQRALKISRLDISWQQVDAQYIPLPDQSFDVVVANFMLYHVPDRRRALSEMHRVLRPGGVVYAATNGADHMREIFEVIRRFSSDRSSPESSPRESSFTLQNGPDQLAEFFSDVRTRRFPNELRVAEAGPLVSYARSTIPGHQMTDDDISRLEAWAKEKIATDGYIHISTDGGLIEAHSSHGR